nr:MAG TPA: hypothetical protein [Caudoviricetes sp.]
MHFEAAGKFVHAGFEDAYGKSPGVLGRANRCGIRVRRSSGE